MTILVADDSAMSRKWIIRAFPESIKENCTIIEASDGKMALDKFRTHQPSLTFLDLTMPEMNGTEVLAYIREEQPQAYVAVVTADRQKSIADLLVKLNANKVIYKPIDNGELQKVFFEYLKNTGEN